MVKPKYVGLLCGIRTLLIMMFGLWRVCSAMTSVFDSLISRRYYYAHSMVTLTSLCSSSLFHPKRIRSSANRRWLILWSNSGILTPQSSIRLSFRESISGITLNHIGEDIPPYRTPFCIWKALDSLLLIRSWLVPAWHISASIETVSGLHPTSFIVSYSCGRFTESKAFFRSIRQQ